VTSGQSGLACGAARRLKGSWRPRRGLAQKGDVLPKSRRGDDPLVIPRLPVWRFEGTEGRFYVIDGVSYPSTTTVLSVLMRPGLASWARRTIIETVRELVASGADIEEALQLAESEPERQRDIAAQKGSQVHGAIALALEGKPYPPEWEAWVRAALSFLADYGLRLVAAEQVLVSKRHGFAGTCDLITCGADGVLTLVDWKTGGIWPEAALQLGAYAIALEEMTGRPVGEAYVVGLREKGYGEKRVFLPQAREGFLACLTLWRALQGGLYE